MAHSQNPTLKVNDQAKINKKLPPVLAKYQVSFQWLLRAQKKIELPMLVLSFVWLCVLVTELAYGVNQILNVVGAALWIIFIFYFLIRLVIVPSRVAFLKKNWLFVLAILVSALRFVPGLESFPWIRALTATFGMQVIWIFASADQGMRSIRKTLGRRGVGYALTFTAVVIFAGAAGMLHFEQASEDPERIQTYPRALWWTIMQMTNIGSAYYLKSEGGRAICLAISIYAAAMFGYLTALFASFFIDREIKDPKIEIARQKQLLDLQNDLTRLNGLIEDLVKQSPAKKQSVGHSISPSVQGSKSHDIG